MVESGSHFLCPEGLCTAYFQQAETTLGWMHHDTLSGEASLNDDEPYVRCAAILKPSLLACPSASITLAGMFIMKV